MGGGGGNVIIISIMYNTQVLKATCEISDTDKTDQMNIKRKCLKRSLSGKKCCMKLHILRKKKEKG